MSGLDIIALVVALALGAYVTAAMLWPEWFE
jgi:K+-transporting ATPase KdpF subunit